MSQAVPKPFRWGGVATSETDDTSKIHLYIVDARAMTSDISVCGPANGSKGPDPCLVALMLQDNCAVVGHHIIACDVTLIIRTNYFALVHLLEDRHRTGIIAYGIPAFFNAYFSLDLKAKNTNERFQIAETLNRLIGANEQYQRVASVLQEGFLRFVLLHELGHIVHGDDNGILPLCAFPNNDIEPTALTIQIEKEKSADEYALSHFKRVPTGELTSDFAAPLFLIDMSYLLFAKVLVDRGIDPDGFHLETVDRDLQNTLWADELRRTCKGAHPFLLRRFALFAQAPQFVDAMYLRSDGLLRYADNHEVLCKVINKYNPQ